MRLMAMLRWSVVSLLSLVVISPAAFADDWNAPLYRGGELSVRATWNDLNWKSGGISQQPVLRSPSSMEQVEGSNGVWNSNTPAFAFLAGQNMGIGLPNFIDQEPLKKARIQLAGRYEFDEAGTAIPTWWGEDGEWGVSGDPVEDWRVSGWDSDSELDNAMFRVSTDFEIGPNPDWEVFSLSNIPQGVLIEQVVVDTISIPEPSTLTLAGLGTLLMGVYVLRRRRRS